MAEAMDSQVPINDTSEDDETTQVKGRVLGLAEIMHNILLYCAGSGIYFHVGVFDSTTEITNEQFTETFRILVNFQPLLRMKIINPPSDSDDNPRQYFEPIPAEDALDLKWVNVSCTGEWTEVMEKEKSASINPETGPLWKAIIGKVVKTQEQTSSKFSPKANTSTPQAREEEGNIQPEKWEYVIVFYIHHGIVDGVSCFDLICNQFIPILNKTVNNKPQDDVFKRPLPLPPTLENAFLGKKDFHPPWYVRAVLSFLHWKTLAFGGKSTGDNLKPPIYSQEIPNDTPGACFSKILIPADPTSKIINECQHHGVGVHSALLTAISYAMAHTMKEFGANPNRLTPHSWPIDLRKFIPELTTPHTLGCLVSVGSSKIKLPESLEFDAEQAWVYAKKLNKSVRATLDRKAILSFGARFLIGMIGTINKSDVHPLKGVGDFGIRVHFGLSNLGNCDAVSKLEVTSPHFVDLKESYFGSAMNDATYWLKDGVDVSFMGPFISALTFKGCMNIAVSYWDRWLSKEFIEKFLANTEGKLSQMCKS